MDVTLIQASVNLKSIRRKDGGDDNRPPEDWRDQPRSNETHQSKTDPKSQLYRNTNAETSLPSYLGHVLTDNRHGLVVNVQASAVDGMAERDVAAAMLANVSSTKGKRVKGYGTKGFVKTCRYLKVTPHVAQNTARRGGSKIDGNETLY